MSIFRFRSILVLALRLAPCSLLHAGEASPPAPAQNWVLPVFTDKEGYRVLTARGSTIAAPAPDGSVSVTNLNITVFSGDAAARVEYVFLSPLARFHPKDYHATGDQTVRILRDDLEATSVKWVYDHPRKHVTMDGNVRIVFNAELKILLK